MTCLHVVLEHVNDSSLTFFIILVSVQRSEESFRYSEAVCNPGKQGGVNGSRSSV